LKGGFVITSNDTTVLKHGVKPLKKYPVVAVDGCTLNCATETLKFMGVEPAASVQVISIIKGETSRRVSNITQEEIDMVREKIEEAVDWTIYATLIGIAAGIAALVFEYLLDLSSTFFRDELTAVIPLAIVPAIGGMIAGFIIYRFAPEAEGHGTDAVISCFHSSSVVIQKRIPLIKAIASVVTIGSGGSAGKEGPIAQIAAGIGSILGSRLKLSDRDRRLMVVSGMSAGIGSIFKSPLGGALFGIEVLYKRDFEMSAIVPAIMSSVIGYAIFTHFVGREPIFLTCHCIFENPLELIFYGLLGLICAAVGIFYIWFFYSARDKFFRRLKIPDHVKPAIGGIGIGVLIILFPDLVSGIIGSGYGALQDALLDNLALSAMILLILAKILATSFTVGSGGSGGVFAPSLVIGGMVGGVVGELSHIFFPNIVTNPACFVLVGMASFFSGVAKENRAHGLSSPGRQ